MYLHQLLLVALVASAIVAKKARFDNYKVYRVWPATQEQLAHLRTLEEKSDSLDFWTEATRVHSSVDVMVPPHKQPDFGDFLKNFNIDAEELISDVQTLTENERSLARSEGFSWDDYHPLETIYAWLDSLVESYPQVSGIVGGTSYEGRQIRGVKVSFGQSDKPGVFIEAGIHAREWIGPATATYILNQVLTSTDPAVRKVVEAYDWYVFPSFNPDGYSYTHTTNRMWRKTRSPHGLCYGVDPNRNWGFHWMDGGASTEPCSQTYGGPEAFSETETKTMSEYISTIADKIDVYLAYHSYSQLLMFPYGFSNEHISNYDTLMKIGNDAAAVLAKRYGTQYTVGNIVDTIYVASGGSMDWVRGTYNTTIPYTYELRDTGHYGFLLPADQIIPTAEETLDSVITILQESLSIVRPRYSA